MTLFRGCRVVKLGQDGQPLMDPAGEIYVEYEVAELGNLQGNYDPESKADANEGKVFAILKKLR